jgi:hypothetical protein
MEVLLSCNDTNARAVIVARAIAPGTFPLFKALVPN